MQEVGEIISIKVNIIYEQKEMAEIATTSISRSTTTTSVDKEGIADNESKKGAP